METSNRIALQIENIQVLTTLKPFLAGFVLAVFFLESNAVECDIYMLIRDFHIVIPLDPFWKRLVALRREYRFSTGAVENGMKPGFQIAEQDIWQYIWLENIDIVPLYLAAERPVLERDGMLMMIDDNRIDLQPGEVIKKRMVRFRTLGCWPLTGAVESNAQTQPEIIEEMLVSTTSERQGRVIDRDQAGSMELKKRQGYF